MDIKRFLRGLALAFYAIFLPLVLFLSLFFILRAETFAGHLFGATVLLSWSIPGSLLYIVWTKNPKKSFFIISLFITLVPGIWLALLTPLGTSNANIRSLFLGDHNYNRLSVGNLIPEIDQLKFAMAMAPAVDPIIDVEQGKRIAQLVLPIYRDIENSEYQNLGSIMGYSYGDVFGNGTYSGHCYQYLPQRENKLPVIIFLHGMGGNFKIFPWVWQKFADRHGFAVLCPSFGFGHWYKEDGIKIITQVRDYCRDNPQLDENNIYLAGISNGAMGVLQVAAKYPDDYQGCIFISPALFYKPMEKFIENWKNKRVLIIHGEQDRRIPEYIVDEWNRELLQQKVNVSYLLYSKEDHYLFLSSRKQLLKDINSWLITK